MGFPRLLRWHLYIESEPRSTSVIQSCHLISNANVPQNEGFFSTAEMRCVVKPQCGHTHMAWGLDTWWTFCHGKWGSHMTASYFHVRNFATISVSLAHGWWQFLTSWWYSSWYDDYVILHCHLCGKNPSIKIWQYDKPIGSFTDHMFSYTILKKWVSV